jgi:hypothetical protein
MLTRVTIKGYRVPRLRAACPHLGEWTGWMESLSA